MLKFECDRSRTSVPDHALLYSNLSGVALSRISVISWNESNPKAGKFMRLWVRCSAWFSLSLMLWMAAVESIHTHTNQTEAATCNICVVAHSASPAISIAHDAPVFAAVGVFQEESILPKAHIESSHLGIRGPPEVL
jgi:hypothetical protein